MRAARHIAAKTSKSTLLPQQDKGDCPYCPALQDKGDCPLCLTAELKEFINGITCNCTGVPQDKGDSPLCLVALEDFREKQVSLQKEMSRCAAHIRDEEAIPTLAAALKEQLNIVFDRIVDFSDLPGLLKYRDMLITDLALLSAITKAGKAFGSRGSALYNNAPPKEYETSLALYTKMTPDGFETWTAPVRPIPERDTWFETVWNTSCLPSQQ